MTRKQSLVFFSLVFVISCVSNFLKVPATEGYSTAIVFLGGVAEALGVIVLPAIVIAIWALVSLARKKSLPENLVKNGALLMATCLILVMLLGIVQLFK